MRLRLLPRQKPQQLRTSQWIASFLFGFGSIIILGQNLWNLEYELHEDYYVGNEESVSVFYNLFVANESDAPRVAALVKDQLADLHPEHSIFFHTIGYSIDVTSWGRLLMHHDEGSELDTLHSLWQYCNIHETAKVVYLHSKGSFHDTPENNALRGFLTVGALSRNCLELPSECNVCSSRFSPRPHPHTPGNMWLARCQYVRELINPHQFKIAMNHVAQSMMPTNNKSKPLPDYCIGRNRFAAEHWVYSHPLVMPCDLCRDARFQSGYRNIPPINFERRLAMAPRFGKLRRLTTKPKGQCGSIGRGLKERLDEYKLLYNATPVSTWWGWAFYDLLMNHGELLLRLASRISKGS
jgi:hypothetical protein